MPYLIIIIGPNEYLNISGRANTLRSDSASMSYMSFGNISIMEFTAFCYNIFMSVFLSRLCASSKNRLHTDLTFLPALETTIEIGDILANIMGGTLP